MNCKQNTVKRLKLLGLIDNADISLTIIDACNLLGVIGVSFIPTTIIIDRHVFYPGVSMRYGNDWEDVIEFFPYEDDINAWDSFGQAYKEAIDQGVEWLVANKTLSLTDAQKIKLAEVQGQIFGASSGSFTSPSPNSGDTSANTNSLGDTGIKLSPTQKQFVDALFGGKLPDGWSQINNGNGPTIIGVGPGQGGQITIGPGGVQNIDLGDGAEINVTPLNV